jgi:hypothetical protein
MSCWSVCARYTSVQCRYLHKDVPNPLLTYLYRDHARFLLDVELRGHLYSYNHYFNASLNKRRLQRFEKTFQAKAETICYSTSEESKPDYREMVPLDAFRDLVVQKSNAAQVCDEIHDSKSSFANV